MTYDPIKWSPIQWHEVYGRIEWCMIQWHGVNGPMAWNQKLIRGWTTPYEFLMELNSITFLSQFPLHTSLSIRRFWGKGEGWKRYSGYLHTDCFIVHSINKQWGLKSDVIAQNAYCSRDIYFQFNKVRRSAILRAIMQRLYESASAIGSRQECTTKLINML